MLAGSFRQEVVAGSGATHEEALPGLTDRGDDAFAASDANFYLVHAVRQAHVQWEADGLSAVVDEDRANRHAKLSKALYMAIVYS